MAWRLLKLTPLKPFFFGKQSVFTNTHYATSEYFPQQTQLTGALRLYLMEQSGAMKWHKHGRFCATKEQVELATKLVGKASATHSELNFEKSDDLGLFEFISPMFILKSIERCITDALFEIPHDIVKKECDYMYAIPHKLNDITSKKECVLVENYNVKKGFIEGLGGTIFWHNYKNFKTPQTIYSHDKIFTPYHQVGIGLKEGKQVDEGKFYTKKSYVLEDGYSFGLLVEINEENLKESQKLQNGTITIGADSSTFKVEVMDLPEVLQCHTLIQSIQSKEEKQGTKVVLLSDAIFTQQKSSIHQNAYFQIVPYKVPFKMMQSKESKNSHGQLIKEHKPSYSKSEEKLLIPKGSIYYFESPSKLEDAVGAYTKMGFNQYLILD
jgi:CRISPR type III-B/RAMP module-associated protein Cmr3